MKLFEYILNYSFYFGASLGMALFGGPGLIKQAIYPAKHGLIQGELKSITIDLVSKNDKNHIKLTTKIDETKNSKIYYTHNQEFFRLEKFMCKNRLLEVYVPNCRILNNELPLELTSEQLKNVKHVNYSIENNNIDYIECDGIVFLGKKTGTLVKVVLLIVGVIISAFGTISFFLFIYLLLKNIIYFKRNGHLPELPNMITEGMKGWRSVFSNKPKS